MKSRKFGVIDQFAYMLGDVGGSFVNLYISSFFLIFATYVLGVSPYYMGTLFLVARIIDAFADVIMGSIPDRWKIGKSGDKFLPYINLAKYFMAASLILSFINVSHWSTTAIYVWTTFVYLFYGIAYSADSIPYGSLAAVVTQEPIERTKLSRARAIGGIIVGLGFLSFVPMFIYDKAHHVVAGGFFKVAIVFAILSFISYTGLVKLSIERVRDQNTAKKNTEYKFMDALKAALKNRPLIGMMVASVGSLTVINGASQLAAIVFAEYYHMPNAFMINSLFGVVITLLLFLTVPKLVQKFEKRNLVIGSSVFSLVATAILCFVHIPNVYVFIVIYNIATIASSVFVMVVWALTTDCLDYTELQTGKRFDGTLYSIYSFSRKVGMGIGSALGSFALGWVGFKAGAKVQVPEVGIGVLKMYTVLPFIAFVLMLVGIGLIYNLNRNKTAEMYKALEERRTA